jgi:hypothetical protein
MRADPDAGLRQAAVRRARELAAIYDDLVPRTALMVRCFGRVSRASMGTA